MTQEDKELLLKELCARLPYEVKLLHIPTNEITTLELVGKYFVDGDIHDSIENFKPYLFPLSSMTEEQKADMFNCCYNAEREASKFSDGKLKLIYDYEIVKIDSFNKYHIDYRGLIPMGLALDATGLNIY